MVLETDKISAENWRKSGENRQFYVATLSTFKIVANQNTAASKNISCCFHSVKQISVFFGCGRLSLVRSGGADGL